MRPQGVSAVRRAGSRVQRPRQLAAIAGVVAVGLLAGCTAGSSGGPGPTGATSAVTSPVADGGSASSAGPSIAASSPAPAPDAVITASPATQTAVNPAAPVTVAVAHGRLEAVTLVNPTGKAVSGALSADGTTWKATEALGYSKTYTLSAKAVNADGRPSTKVETFHTLTPSNMTMPYLQILGGAAMTNGATYGVAIVPVVHFDEPITDKAAAMKALVVSTTPHVAGAWYWVDDQNVHFRPKTYWPSATKVTLSADVYGVQVGPGLYGQSDVSSSFTIGRKQVTVADDNSPQVDTVKVYDAAGTVIKTMNTSMGKHGGETVNGSYINFYTPGGTYTVLDHENPAIMSSASYGLPASAPGGYAPEAIYYSTKISIDGIYLHELDTTVWAQNSGYDVSHGCLNLSQANAIWFYNHSIAGDPVVIHPAKGAPTLQLWEGGDWTVPWSTWAAGGLDA